MSAARRDAGHRPAAAAARGSAGAACPAACAGHQHRWAADTDTYQYTLQDPDLNELNQWAPKIFGKLKTLPELADVATDQQTGGDTLTLTIDRDAAARFGIQPQLIDDTLYDAFGQRQVAQIFTQVNSYHVILEVLPELQNAPDALDRIFVNVAGDRPAGAVDSLARWTTKPTTFLSINHQGQFPSVT